MRRRKSIRFRDLGAVVTIREATLGDGILGSWNGKTGTILIAQGQTDAGRLVTLLHESMHLAESMMKQNGHIKRCVTHAFVEGAAYALAIVLARAGVLRDVTPKSLHMLANDHRRDHRNWKARQRRAARRRKETPNAR